MLVRSMSAIAGDTGYQETVEFRHLLGARWQGQWQALAFADSAQVTINKNPTVPGKNAAALNGAGVGLNWAGPYALSAKTYIATLQHPSAPPPPWLRTPHRCAVETAQPTAGNQRGESQLVPGVAARKCSRIRRALEK
jgi:hypothetical protein